MQKSRTTNAKRNIQSGIIGNVASLLLPFVTRTALIRVLGADYAGINGLFTSLLQVLNMAELGVSSAIVFSLYKPLAEKDETLVCALISLYRKVYKIIGTIILITGVLIMPFIRYLIKGDYPFDINIYLVYSISLLNTSISYLLFAYKSALLNADQRQSIITNTNTILLIAKNVIQVLCICLLKNYYIFLIIGIIHTCIYNIWLARVVSRDYPEYVCKGELNHEHKSEIYKQIKGLAIGKLSYTARNSFDAVIISMFCGLITEAIYSNYYYIFQAVLAIILVIIQAVSAGIGNSIATESIDKNYNDFRKLNFYLNWIGSWFTVCLLCLYQPFMKLWVGEKLMASNYTMIFFCIYFYVTQIGQMRSAYCAAAGIWWELRYLQLGEMLANLILNITLGYYFGMNGVICATIFTVTFFSFYGQSIILHRVYFKKSTFNYFFSELNYTLVTTGVCILTYYIYTLFSVEGILQLLLNVIVCIIVPNACFVIITCTNKIHRGYLINVIDIIKK